MKNLFLLLTITAMTAFTAVSGQVQDHAKQDRHEKEKKIKEELKLTSEQTEKFDALNSEYKDKISALENDASLAKDVRKERKMALKKEKQSRVLELLTPEQQTRYKDLMEKKKKDISAKEGS